MARPLALGSLVALAAACAGVVVAQLLSPGYDPTLSTISRLAMPGMPAAWLVDFAIAAIAAACLGLATATTTARVALIVAGAGLFGASAIHLEPSLTPATAGHRLASAVAVIGLVVAPWQLGRRYGPAFFGFGMAEIVLVGAGAVLLATPFEAWGAWERVLLGVAVAWMALLALRIVSRLATISAPKATSSSKGSYLPASSVNSANT